MRCSGGYCKQRGAGIESDGTFTIGLPTEIEPELIEEGFARELVHQIQNLRKEADFKIENTINTYIDCGPKEQKIIRKYDDYIKKETLTQKLSFGKKEECFNREVEVDGSSMAVAIEVVGSIV
ncbi:MAG: DUF5915 domain-containing protein [Actinomycetota bacterium]|nr:DUF5915 domain-containing protein [Actinomycetota bacterium]MDZ7839164.1 DUF5915 domain-containing protein [Actinomycetota bacterium]